MIAITTRYIGPTNTRGSRVTAFAWHPNGKREAVTVPYRHDDTDNFLAAASAWVKRFAPNCALGAVAGDVGNGDQVFLARRADATDPMPFVPVA